jgi:predicted kinase
VNNRKNEMENKEEKMNNRRCNMHVIPRKWRVENGEEKLSIRKKY